MPAPITAKEFEKRIKEKHGGTIKLMSPYTGSVNRIKCKCTVCKHTWEPLAGGLRTWGCPQCGFARSRGNHKSNHEEYLDKLSALHGDLFTPMKTYLRAVDKIPHRCNKCAEVFDVSPACLLQTKRTGCPKCRDKNHPHTLSKAECITRIKQKHGNRYKLLGEFTKAEAKAKFKCTECSNVWRTTPRSIMSGSGCPECAERGAYGGRSPKKPVQLGDRVVMLQGYEPQALEHLIGKGVKPKSISTSAAEGKPSVPYRYEGKEKLYYPDFYIKSKNLIIEVKSLWTLTDQYKKNVAKAKACVELGYKFSLMLMDANGKRISLPKNWFRLTKKQLVKSLG